MKTRPLITTAMKSAGTIKSFVSFLAILMTGICLADPSNNLLLNPTDPINAPSKMSLEAIEKAMKCIVTIILDPQSQTAHTLQMVSPNTMVLTQNLTLRGIGFAVNVGDNKRAILAPANLVTASGQLNLQLDDGRILPVTLYASDEVSNIALLTLDDKTVPTLKWGDSNRITQHQFAASFSSKVSILGQIDGPQRPGMAAGRYLPLFAFVGSGSAGSVGSPIIDEQGDIIGILGSVRPVDPLLGAPNASPVLGPPNLGYALPSNYVKRIVNELWEFKKMRYPWVGMRFVDNPEGGARISRVAEGSPAEAAGIRVNDVVVFCADQQIDSGVELAMTLSHQIVDSPFTLKIRRAGKPFMIKLSAKIQPEIIEKKLIIIDKR